MAATHDDADAGDGVQRTEDGRYIVVNGRRWRATDPHIPEKLRAELVGELMSARRAVQTDPATARPRVQDAKVALGERGDPWWEQTDAGRRVRLEATMRTLLRRRDPESTICPSDAARVVGADEWRDLMDAAREVADALRAAGVVRITQGGVEQHSALVTGPLRIARGPQFDRTPAQT